MKFQMTKIAAAAALALASTGALAGLGDGSVATGGVFNMYSQDGLDQSQVVGNGEMAINVDATIAGFVNQDAGTWGVSSNALFYGLNWTASGGSLITTAGSYVLDTATGAVSAAPLGAVASDGQMHFSVGAGQAAGAINFAWGATTGIRVVNVWNINNDGSLSAVAVPGMENGPFPGFNAAFNFSAPNLVTAVPEASTYGMMLAGLGLVGFAVRRRKLMA
jgi:hypothetical protein